MQDGEQKVGFYSLEMAADLELEPKPYHVIAFEDPGDCKNLCYIIQAHMEMLGNGHAFVVARPPKVNVFFSSHLSSTRFNQRAKTNKLLDDYAIHIKRRPPFM